MNELTFWQSVRLLALEAVLVPDWDSFYRSVCRWYSKSFSTPLLDVFDLPQTWVLQNYYEHRWSEMERADQLDALAEMLETPEERDAKERLYNKNEAEKIAGAERHVAKIREAMANGAMSDKPRDRLGKNVKKGMKTVAKDLEAIRKSLASLGSEKPPAPKSPEAMVTEPDFSFSVGGDFDLDADVLARGIPKKPGK